MTLRSLEVNGSVQMSQVWISSWGSGSGAGAGASAGTGAATAFLRPFLTVVGSRVFCAGGSAGAFTRFTFRVCGVGSVGAGASVAASVAAGGTAGVSVAASVVAGAGAGFLGGRPRFFAGGATGAKGTTGIVALSDIAGGTVRVLVSTWIKFWPALSRNVASC